jgi:hypothetical protein
MQLTYRVGDWEKGQMKKSARNIWPAIYPVALPIGAITPWWAFAKYVLKLNISEYRNYLYLSFLLFFICGLTMTLWNTKIAGTQREQRLIEKIFTGYGKAFAFVIGCEFVLIILAGIFLLFGI